MTGSDDNSLKVWSISDGSIRYTLHGHVGGVWTAQIDQSGHYLVSGSTDRTVKVEFRHFIYKNKLGLVSGHWKLLIHSCRPYKYS